MADLEFTEAQREDLRAFWEVLEQSRDAVDEEVRRVAERLPPFAEVMRAVPEEEQDRQRIRSRELQRTALVEGNWDPYIEDLNEQGARYARMGISFADWFDLVTAFRTGVLGRLEEDRDRDDVLSVAGGLGRFLDIAMATIGNAYVRTKEEVIAQQQEAIRELSTPVLQLRPRLLLVPLVGLIDTDRARHVTESVLYAVRDKRARVVVMDVTGVPIVDSKVANHLVQTVTAARLMGATVLITGISAGIAQTLVTIGAELREVETFGDLEDALLEADLMLQRVGHGSSGPIVVAGS